MPAAGRDGSGHVRPSPKHGGVAAGSDSEHQVLPGRLAGLVGAHLGALHNDKRSMEGGTAAWTQRGAVQLTSAQGKAGTS